MKPIWKKLLVALVFAAIAAGLVFAYRARRDEVAADAADDQPIAAPTRVAVVNGENVVSLDAAARSAGGIVLAPLGESEHRPEVPAYGVVLDLGDLTDLRNSLANAVAQLAKANAARELARQEYERAKTLFAAGQNVAEKSVQTAAGALRTEEANGQAAQAALEAARASAEQRWGAVIAGWLEHDAPEFERIQRGEDLLIQATLPASAAVAAAPAEAFAQLADGRRATAALVSAATRTDPKIQGPSFFYRLAKDATQLLPGMNVVLSLPTGAPEPALVVPASAVVWLQGKAWAYAQVQPDKFVRREIATDQPVPDGWAQPQTFAPRSESFVVRGPQLLLSEEFRAQISVGD